MNTTLLLLAALTALVTPVIGEMLDNKFDTRTISSFKRQLFLSSNHPNYGGFQPVEGWLVTSSTESKTALRRLYYENGKVRIFTPAVGERIYPLKDFRIPFAEVTEIKEGD